MGHDLKKVLPGDRLRVPAGAWNTFIDAAQAHLRSQRSVRARPGAISRQATVVRVRNDTGSDRGQYEVLGLGAPIILPTTNERSFRERVALVGELPTEAAHAGKFAICQEPIPSGRICAGWVAGVTIAKIDVTDEDHEFADVADGVATHLASGKAGSALILWKEPGTGVKWAVIRMVGTLGREDYYVPAGTLIRKLHHKSGPGDWEDWNDTLSFGDWRPFYFRWAIRALAVRPEGSDLPEDLGDDAWVSPVGDYFYASGPNNDPRPDMVLVENLKGSAVGMEGCLDVWLDGPTGNIKAKIHTGVADQEVAFYIRIDNLGPIDLEDYEQIGAGW